MKTNMKTHHGLCGILSGLLWLAAGTAQTHAGLIGFNDSTDTIRVTGNTTLTTAATYEAQVLFATASSGGAIFNEWENGQEDKALFGGPAGIVGYAFHSWWRWHQPIYRLYGFPSHFRHRPVFRGELYRADR